LGLDFEFRFLVQALRFGLLMKSVFWWNLCIERGLLSFERWKNVHGREVVQTYSRKWKLQCAFTAARKTHV